MNALQPTMGRRQLLTRLFKPETLAPTTRLVPLPAMPTRGAGVFWALATDSEGRTFVAGDDGVVFCFDGEQWLPEDSAAEHNIHALCASGDALYSVGWLGQICCRRDNRWHAVQGGSSEPGRVNLPLFDIACHEGEGPWAVGDNGRVCHLRDDEWLEEKVPSNANLRCVLPLGGERVLAGGLGGVLLERDEQGWRELVTDTGCALVGMAQLDTDSFIVVGGEYSIADNTFVGRLFLYRQGEFSEVDTGMRLPRLRKVRRQDDGLLIVGDGGAAYRWTGDGVVSIPGRARYDLHDAGTLTDGSLLICGDGETLLMEQALSSAEEVPTETLVRWERIDQGLTSHTLRTLLEVEPDHIIAAGDGGVVLHLRGDAIEQSTIPGNLTVHALWCSSPRNILAACDAATLAHFDGESWSIVHKGEQDVPLLAITGFGPHDIFAVGDSGLALRYDGLMWRQLETGTRQELYGLWGQDSDHLLAVGGGGLVLRFDGSAWKSFTAGTHQDLYAVHGQGLQRLHLAGLGGTLIRFEDNAWHREFTGIRADLHAIAGDHVLIACGSNGTILRKDGADWQPEASGVTSTLQSLLWVRGECYAAGAGGTLLKRLSAGGANS